MDFEVYEVEGWDVSRPEREYAGQMPDPDLERERGGL